MSTANQKPANVMGVARDRGPRSINKCLLILGAPRCEVYGPTKRRGSKILGRSSTTIYDRLSKIEIYNWACWLKKQSLKNYHPDRRRMGKHVYTRKSQEITEAFNRLVQILEHRK